MFVTRKSLPRRTVLRGLGASLALPLLDGMVPGVRHGRAPGAPARGRVRAERHDDGALGAGRRRAPPSTSPPSSQPLEPLRRHVQVLSGMHGAAGPGTASAGVDPIPDRGAREAGERGRRPRGGVHGPDRGSGPGPRDPVGDARAGPGRPRLRRLVRHGFSCAYTNTIAWADATTPLPMENNPRIVFERLFGDAGSTDAAIRQARRRRDASLLDSVRERTHDLARGLGPQDHLKLDQYLDAVRDVERRIRNGGGADRPRPAGARPAGGHSRHLRRAREADVRLAGPRLRDRPHAGRHLHAWTRADRPDLCRDRGARRPPPDLAPPARPREAGQADEDQPLSRAALRRLPGPAAGDARRRRGRCSTTR